MKKPVRKIAALLLVAALLAACAGTTPGPVGFASLIETADTHIPLVQRLDYDGSADYDGDGLTNDEELALGTSPFAADTDGDGLSDYDEVNVYGTDPLNPDTDGDGIPDGLEILAGLDPLNPKSDGTTPDGSREFSREDTIGDASLRLTGNANIGGLLFEELALPGIEQMPGVVSPLYEIHMQDGFKAATLTVSYDANEVEAQGYSPERLSLFQFTNTGEFEPVASTVDTDAGTVTAALQHFSRYILADADILDTVTGVKVMLLLDNSGSMYAREIFEDSEENDPEFKRVDFAHAFVDRMPSNMQAGVAKFTADYTVLAGMGSEPEALHDGIDTLRTVDEVFNGTYIGNSLYAAASSFNSMDYIHRKFIVMLTDGRTTEPRSVSDLSLSQAFDMLLNDADVPVMHEDTVIDTCRDQKVSVIMVGLGHDLDTEYLQKIATNTGGIYIHADTADALERVYEAIYSYLNFGLEDLDENGVADGIIVADSGFRPSVNGFAFNNQTYLFYDDPNEALHNGLCYGMASFAQLYYTGRLPLAMDAYQHKHIFNKRYEMPGYDISQSTLITGGRVSLANHDLGMMANYIGACINSNPITITMKKINICNLTRKRWS